MVLWHELVRRIRGLYIILFLFSLINLSVCIYEDQIGKFDWRQTYVGRIKFARLDTLTAARRIIVATEENVLAAINLKTGQVVWRHVFESAASGELRLLHVGEYAAVTVSGSNPYIVRGWDTASGLLMWEWSMTLTSLSPDASMWFVHQGQLYHVLPEFGSHLEISSYGLKTGQNRGSSARLSAPWVNKGCVLSAPRFTCISGDYGSKFIFSVDLTSTDSILTKPLSAYVDWAKSNGDIKKLYGLSSVPGFVLDSNIVVFEGNELKVLPVKIENGASVTITESAEGPTVFQVYSADKKLQVSAHRAEDGSLIADMSHSTTTVLRSPELAVAVCTREQRACRWLVTGEDHSLTLLRQQGQVLWTREEALANIVAVEFVDLPVSELEAAIENEFDHKEGDIWGAFTRRLHSQLQQLTTSLQALLKMATQKEAQDKDDGDYSTALVRDDLDLHKIIVAVTSAGKIYGLDNLSGNVLWSVLVPGMSTRGVAVFTQRSARHPPHDAQLSVVASNMETGNGLVVSLNPITGTLLPEGPLELDYRLKQAAMLPRADAQHLRALVLLDQDDSVQVLPVSSSRLVQDFYMFVADRETTRVQGYALKYNGREVDALKTWSLVLGGSDTSEHRLVRVLAKSARSLHSPGKVMGDRSVLYKYSNPNLALFVTQGPDPVHKDVVHSFLVDVVSGALVTSLSHKRARATPHAVHADNLVAYAYYNDKQRRTEIATLELYEGATRSLPAGAAFSSLAEPRAPLVERQTYILPALLTAMVDTVTEKGITDKHVLLSLSNGLIIELPWAWLAPRRAAGAPGAEPREEAPPPPAPELPLPAEAAINYNRTLRATRAVHTAHAGLESTCLVFAYGLDVYYTRVAPSKTFDLLKEDFDYYLITLVLGALLAATYGTKHFAARKMLKQAWK